MAVRVGSLITGITRRLVVSRHPRLGLLAKSPHVLMMIAMPGGDFRVAEARQFAL